MLEGLLDSEAAKIFVTPLNDIIKVGITEKVLLSITDDGIRISCIKPDKSNFVILKYKKDFLNHFKLPKIPETFGVKDLSELVGIMRAFADGFNIKIEKNIMTISSGTSVFTYYGCNEKHCSKAPKAINPEQAEYTTFIWDEAMKSFSTAIAQLKEQKHIVVSGNKDDTVANIMVTDQQFKRYNNFCSKINCTEVTETFRRVIDKLIFHPVVTGSLEKYVVRVREKCVIFQGSTPEFSLVHSVSTKVKS